MADSDIRDMVKEAYGTVARKQNGCCGPAACGCSGAAAQPVPEADLGLSCGDPAAFDQIRPGDTVVDLGSGAGRDVFIAARQTGPQGKVIGVDMTDDMLGLARLNAVKFAAREGYDNVEFRKGYIEDLPVEDGSVDVVISNCVINLSPDKPKVFREVHRVLRPGGRMVVSDIVLNRELPSTVRENASLYAACIAGALRREAYLEAVRGAGFAEVRVLKEVLYTGGYSLSDPVTQGVAEDLTGIASSLTVLATR
ncbi:MAG: arsenite methyltransferase [Acidobacteria bacterium]|nr:arsenite methyltransferase [Acidobacteriota bacterium]